MLHSISYQPCHQPQRLPSVLCSNVRSVVPKLDQISATLQTKCVDIFVATESWLGRYHSDDSIALNRYTSFRDDRKGRIGGGVAVWVKQSLFPIPVPLINKPLDIECVAVNLSQSHILLLGCYIPPVFAAQNGHLVSSFIIGEIDRFLSAVPTLSYDVVLCGDFNRLNMSTICLNCDLVNIHRSPTYGSAELDYILISESLKDKYSITTNAPFDFSKVPHLSLLASPKSCKMSPTPIVYKPLYDLRKSYIEAFVTELSRVNWSSLYKIKSVDQKCNFFHEVLNAAVNKTIPKKLIKMSSKEKPWMTPLIKNLINDRWQAFRQKDFTRYLHLKVKVRAAIEKAKTKWLKKINPMNMWKSIKFVMNKSSGTCTHSLGNLVEKFSNAVDAAENINEHLSNVFQSSGTLRAPKSDEHSSLPIVIPQTVFHFLKTLKSSKSSPDIPTALYKYASHLLCDPLCHLYNISIQNSVFPDTWKIGAVVPLPKKPQPTLSDIRPITLLPVPAKIMERVVLSFVKEDLLKCYGTSQFGFRPKSSTLCALIAVQDHITASLENPTIVGMQLISYDFSKAFDKLKFDVILNRLSSCGLPNWFLSWLGSYLTNRKQYVRVNNAESSVLPVLSGVPQGSIIGPFLFAAVAGSMSVDRADSVLVQYADDCTLSIPLYGNSDNDHVLQLHQKIINWSVSNCLPLNVEKCKSLVIKKSSLCCPVVLNAIPFVESLILLGVTITSNLSWKKHFDNVVLSASRRLYPLRILKPHASKSQLICIFNACVRSILEYCGPLFIGATLTDQSRLEAIQKRFHKLLCGPKSRCECLPSLKLRRERAALKLVKQMSNYDHLLCTLLPSRSSSSNRFILPHIRTTRRLNSFVIKAVLLWNS